MIGMYCPIQRVFGLIAALQDAVAADQVPVDLLRDDIAVLAVDLAVVDLLDDLVDELGPASRSMSERWPEKSLPSGSLYEISSSFLAERS
jgi:hypothetical protein